MSRALLVLWIATLGADRFDLFGGAGPFVLKPLLILLPPILVLELRRIARRDQPLIVPRGTAWLFIAHTLFLAVLLVTVMYSGELEMGVRRLALLTVESYATFLIVLALANREEWREILVRGAWLGLLLILFFNIVQVSRWAGGPAFDWLALGGIIDLTPSTYGPWLPRPSGVSIDPNRGGLLIIVYLFLLATFGAARGRMLLAIVIGVPLLLATLSRSALLAAAVLAGVWLLRRPLAATPAGVVLGSLVVAAGAAALMLSPGLQAVGDDLVTVVTERASFSEGSSSIHFALLAHGWEVGTASIRNALLGVGFGNSYLVLQEFFPGDKYGNFHSAYVTLLVESGMLAVVFFLVLLLAPLLAGASFAPLLAALFAFNIFYQTHVEAAFWFVIALAWMIPYGAEGREGVARPSSRDAVPAAQEVDLAPQDVIPTPYDVIPAPHDVIPAKRGSRG